MVPKVGARQYAIQTRGLVAMNSCWILCTERTGSTYLADLLNSTGIWGDQSTNDVATGRVDRFTEYYCDRFFDPAHLEVLPRFNKITWWQFTNYFSEDFEVEAHLPDIRFVRLKRDDTKAVAVSYYIAKRFAQWLSEKYGLAEERWNVHQQSVLEEFQKVEIPINRFELKRLYQKAQEDRFLWDGFLRGREFLEFDYQDLLSTPMQVVENVLVYINAEGSPDLDWPKLPLKAVHPIRAKLRAALEDSAEVKFL
jgi:LPS sulfotransferase NodH